MLRGRYEHNIDAKGRIFVPSKLREKLGEKFIAAVAFDQCINLYSEERWNQLLESLAMTLAPTLLYWPYSWSSSYSCLSRFSSNSSA